MTVNFHARGSTVAHTIDASVATAMHSGGRTNTECLRCGERLRAEGTFKSWGELWAGVNLCGGERDGKG